MTWLAWAVAATICVQLAPNPLYALVVVGIAALVVVARADRTSPYARAFGVLVTLATLFVGVRVLLAAVSVRATGPVLVTLPAVTLPRVLGGVELGGPVALSVVLGALADGIVIVAIVAAFGAFNAVASHFELVQRVPRAFYEAGLIVAVALAFVPSTIAAAAAVREADRARTGGTVVRRRRIPRLVLPVLESGLEKAVALAESMDARGFGRPRDADADRWAGRFTAVAAVALGAAFVALVGQAPEAAGAAAVVGVVFLGVAVRAASQAGRRTRYRLRSFGRADVIVGVVACVAPVVLGVLVLAGDPTLAWTDRSRPPGFGLGALVALACLALPAFWPAVVPVPGDRPVVADVEAL